MNERLVLGRIKHHLDTVHSAGSLETKHRLGIGLETHAPVTRGADKENHGLTHLHEYTFNP